MLCMGSPTILLDGPTASFQKAVFRQSRCFDFELDLISFVSKTNGKDRCCASDSTNEIAEQARGILANRIFPLRPHR